jgi:hypothetical protein
MKIGFYCESPVDQAAMRVFTEGILGDPPEPINMDLEGHSVPAFFSALDGVFRGVYYNSDAEGLVIVADCDDTELHDPAHDAPGGDSDRCRLCRVRKIIAGARISLKPRPSRPDLKVAIGLTVPSIEAWLLTGKEHQVGEAAWKVALAEKRPPYTTRQLKRLVYATDRASLEVMTARAVAEARRIILNIKAIETAFPAGFGSLARQIRTWMK